MNPFEKLTVYTKTDEYPIYIDQSFGALVHAFSEAGLANRSVLLVSDANVSNLYGNDVRNILAEFSDSVFEYIIPPGENSKSIALACELYRKCIESNLDRTSVIVALGGGVVGDLAGFTAATFMRGVNFVQIPTTLLAQLDSSVGGKVAVNLDGIKNIVGAFYQPRFVYSNMSTLVSLPYNDLLSGLAEAVKMALVHNENYFNFIMHNTEKISALDFEAIAGVVYGSCNIKAEIVLKDEREQNIRELLNLGHTFGHGIESASDFEIPHGHAVAIGCMAALSLSKDRGFITHADIEAVKNIYQQLGLPSSLSGYRANEIYEHIKYDKKSKKGVLTVILLHRIGCAYAETTLTKSDLIKAIDSVIA